MVSLRQPMSNGRKFWTDLSLCSVNPWASCRPRAGVCVPGSARTDARGISRLGREGPKKKGALFRGAPFCKLRKADYGSAEIFDLLDFIDAAATWCCDLHAIAFLLADQGTGNGR